MKVIAISGKAQHGKDTSAAIMKDMLVADGNRVLITHYADLLKYMCRTFFGWDGQKNDSGRHILQYVGTDIIRNKRPDFWADFIIDVLTLFQDDWDFVLIPDCRFPNEVERLKKAGLDMTHMRVIRENFISPLSPEQQIHPSETALDNYVPDCYIENKGSIGDLTKILSDWLTEFNGVHQITIEEYCKTVKE